MRFIALFFTYWSRAAVLGDSVAGLVVRLVFLVAGALGTVALLNEPIELFVGMPDRSWIDRTTSAGYFFGVAFAVLWAAVSAGAAWNRARRTIPRMEIVFDPRCCARDVRPGTRAIFIGVRNLGADSLDDVSVAVTALIPRRRYLQGPCTLHGADERTTVVIHPSGTRHDHFAFLTHVWDTHGNPMQLDDTLGPVPIPAQKYEGIFSARAKNAVEITAPFQVDFDDLGRPVISLLTRSEGKRIQLEFDRQHVASASEDPDFFVTDDGTTFTRTDINALEQKRRLELFDSNEKLLNWYLKDQTF